MRPKQPKTNRMSRNLKLTLSGVLVAGLLFAGCGTDKQKRVGQSQTFTSPDGNIGYRRPDHGPLRHQAQDLEGQAGPKCQRLRWQPDRGRGKANWCAGDTTLNSLADVAAGRQHGQAFECQTQIGATACYAGERHHQQR